MSRPIIIYDFNVIPEFGSDKGDYNVMMEIYSKDKVILWDSTKGTPGVNCEPKIIISEDDTDIPLKIKDVAGVVPDRLISPEVEKSKGEECEEYARFVRRLISENKEKAMEHICTPQLEGIMFTMTEELNNIKLHYTYINEKGEKIREQI